MFQELSIKQVRYLISFISFLIALCFWVVESAIHYVFFDQGHEFEIWPHDDNELWMRLIIFVFILLTGQLLSIIISRILKSEREKMELFRNTMNTVQDLVGNFLMHAELVSLQYKSNTLDQTTIDEFRSSVKQLKEKLHNLSNLKKLEYKNISHGIAYVKNEQTETKNN